MSQVKNNKGFTLIELVIVLAIGALIIAGVLIAVGGAQRSQRDNSRKEVAARVATVLENYASNHDGSYGGFGQADCGGASKDPSVDGYCKGVTDPDTKKTPTVVAAGNTNTNANAGIKIVVASTPSGTGAVCGSYAAGGGGGGTVNGAKTGTNARQYAIVYWSENAKDTLCIDNNK